MDRRRVATLAAAVLLTGALMQAQTGVLYTYNGTTAGLTLVGNAATAVTADGTVLRVAPALLGQSGAVYYTTPVPLGSSDTFSTQFQFRFTGQGGIDPADGLAFVLGTSTTGLGLGGGGLGYQGLTGNSVAIEFDTFNNGGADTSSNHVAIDIDGVLTDTALVNPYGVANCDFGNGYTQPGCMANGDLWTATVTYDGAHLTVTLSDPREGTTFTALNNYAIDIASILGQNTAYAGFSSSTGSGWENHDVVTWTFANTPTLSPVTAAAPALSDAALGVLALLMAGLAFQLLRKERLGSGV